VSDTGRGQHDAVTPPEHLAPVEHAAPRAAGPGGPTVARVIDAVPLWIGRVAAWLFVVLTVAIVGHVVLRYGLRINYVWLEELHWQLYAFLATLGISYALSTDNHVRLDLLHHRFGPRLKAVIEIAGLLGLVLPLTALLVKYGFDAASQSYQINERSVSADGLPYTWVVKSAIPVGFVLVGLSAAARLIRSAAIVVHPPPTQTSDDPDDRPWPRAVKLVLWAVFVLGAVALASWVGRIHPSYALVVAMFATFIGLLFSGFPIAFVLGGVAVVFIFVGYGTDLAGITLNAEHAGTKLYLGTAGAFVNRIYGGLLNKPELVALPMFIFMGLMLDRSGMAERMMHAMQRLFGRVRGGLAITVVLIGILLAASTGIIGASVVLLGLLSLPVMLGQGYAKPLATGVVCSAGTLGILMPPSIMLVIMADQASVPVGDLFMGAVFPSVILGALYVVYLVGVGLFAPRRAPLGEDAEPLTVRAFVDVVLAILPALGLILAVLGSIFAGIATVTEASGIGAAGASVLAFVHWARTGRKESGDSLGRELVAFFREGWKTCISAFEISGYIIGILVGATCFAFILRELGGDQLIRLGLESLPLGPMGIVVVILAVIFLLGFFLDWIEITIIVLPLVVTVVAGMDLGLVDNGAFAHAHDLAEQRAQSNVIWFCVLMAVCLQTSFLTPPVGFALFYLKGVAPRGVRLVDIYRGVMPFIVLQLIGLALVLLLGRHLVLWLPRAVYGSG